MSACKTCGQAAHCVGFYYRENLPADNPDNKDEYFCDEHCDHDCCVSVSDRQKTYAGVQSNEIDSIMESKSMDASKAFRTVRVLRNTSFYSGINPTIRIVEGDPNWNTAYAAWMEGKDPTDSPEWKDGAYLFFEPVEELPEPIAETKAFKVKLWMCIASVIIGALALLLVRLFKFH